jgi:RimJ/RimL family protein N-acetyltransferase
MGSGWVVTLVISPEVSLMTRPLQHDWLSNPDRLATRRVFFRRWRSNDRSFYREMCSDPDVMAHLDGPQSADDADEDFDYLSRRSPTFFALCHASDGRPLGFCGVLQLEEDDSQSLAGEHEIGWRLITEAWGYGYASEAAASVLSNFYADMSVFPRRRVICRIDPSNVRSIALARRLGLQSAPELVGPDEREHGLSVYVADRSTLLAAFASLPRKEAPLAAAARWARRTSQEIRGHISLASPHAMRVYRPVAPALMALFRIDDREHFLRADQLRWLDVLETQATRGWKYFLTEGDVATQAARQDAFRAALHAESRPPRLKSERAEVFAELAVAGRAGSTLRIDLALRHDCDPCHWTIVEAKFGHLLDNDLRAYERSIPKGHSADFFILGVNHDGSLRKNWSFVSWHAFLTRFHSIIDVKFDSSTFRAFRRSNFVRASAYVR